MKKSRLNLLIVSLLATFFGLVAGALLMLAIGSNPIDGYWNLFQGGLGFLLPNGITRLGDTLAKATPLIFTGLSVAFAFRTGLFNIGAAGQMLFGGLCAVAVGLTFTFPQPVMILLVVFAGCLGGAIWGIIPGFLKAKFNVHEVVSTIMMNWIAYWIVYYTIPAFFKGPFLETESKLIPDAAGFKMQSLSNLFGGSEINLGLFFAIASVILIAFILNKTVLGYELKAVGFNRHAAEYAGINVNRNIILSMMIAGGLAGLAGAAQYMGNATSMQIGVMPTQGFDGIAVALLGANTPLGALLAALFFGILYTGKGYMNAKTSIPPEIADTIIATIIYFAATSILIQRVIEWTKKKGPRKLERQRIAEESKPIVVNEDEKSEDEKGGVEDE
ncbi:MAG: ABC transporter permease [Clostridia bacterium]